MRTLQRESSPEQSAAATERGETLPVEGHTVHRWCGHLEILHVWKPWNYVDRVAALVTCAACRRQGIRGPLDFVREHHEAISSGVVTSE